MTTSEQQAVPVAQEDREALERVGRAIKITMGDTIGRIGANKRVVWSASGSWTGSQDVTIGDIRTLHRLASHPCKSGENAGELPEAMPGHWSSAGGLAMAMATLDDPHMARSRERISDFALANEVFLSPGIANLTDAKERIRWLSASLAVALRPDATQTREAELVAALERTASALGMFVILIGEQHPGMGARIDAMLDDAAIQEALGASNAARAALNARGGA